MELWGLGVGLLSQPSFAAPKLTCGSYNYWDGALGFNVPEFDTFTRFKLPVVALVGNEIAREQVPMLGFDMACNLDYCSYETVAEVFGGHVFLLEHCCSSEKEIRDTLWTQKLSHKGKPVLINCLIGKSNFREGSI